MTIYKTLLLICLIFSINAQAGFLQELEKDYTKAVYNLQEKAQKKEISLQEIENAFLKVQKELNSYCYQGHTNTKNAICHLLRGIDPEIATDVSILIDKLSYLLGDLEIYYHDIQHSLEVTLATTQIMTQAFKNKEVKDPKSILLTVTAALFHDVGYSNNKEILSFITSLEKRKYESLFTEAKSKKFSEDFSTLVNIIEQGTLVTGAEFHLYHVFLGQITLAYILDSLKNDLIHGKFLLEKPSLDSINAMICLTDIRGDTSTYREKAKLHLEKTGLFFHGEALRTSDLLTQMATRDRLAKTLPLYHEFVLGNDAYFWSSGLALLATTTEFYENFAKKQFSDKALSLLNEHFSSTNPYQKTLPLVFFLHKAFELPYKKLLEGDPITEIDIAFLEGLEKNGLPIEVVQLFQATKSVREGKPIPSQILTPLQNVLAVKDSVLEISLGDHIRVTLLQDALIHQKVDLTRELLQKNTFRKIEVLSSRTKDWEFIQKHSSQKQKSVSD